MAGMMIPDVNIPQPLSIADAIGQWQNINHREQQSQLLGARAKQMQQEQARQDQLRGAFANGKPTADSLYALDPEFAANYEKQQSQIQGQQAEYDEKKHVALKNLATDALTKLEQSGIQDPNQAQEFLNQYQHNMKPYIQKVLGLPGDADMSLDQIKTLAGSSVGSPQDWIVANDAQRGSFMLNKKTGEVKPLEHGGKQITPPQYSPELQGDIALQRSSNTIDKVTGPDQRDRFMTKGQAAGIGSNQPKAPTLAFDQEEQGALLQAAREDNPDLKMRDAARARIEQMAGGYQPPKGPVMGPTPGEIEAGKQTAKNDAELAQARQKRLISVGNMAAMLEKPIQGQSIESLIKESTGSGVGNAVDSVAQFAGMTTKGAEAIAKLKPVAEWLVSMAPRMEGPQSNFDVERYKAMAGDIADATKTPTQRIAAYNSLLGMLKDYQKTEGGNNSPAPGKIKFLGFE